MRSESLDLLPQGLPLLAQGEHMRLLLLRRGVLLELQGARLLDFAVQRADLGERLQGLALRLAVFARQVRGARLQFRQRPFAGGALFGGATALHHCFRKLPRDGRERGLQFGHFAGQLADAGLVRLPRVADHGAFRRQAAVPIRQLGEPGARGTQLAREQLPFALQAQAIIRGASALPARLRLLPLRQRDLLQARLPA